ncbi:MAG: hypothetical protein ASARMPRED_007928 [Alectoria sarmentosa]|nr:MAG: hypothetical protein ASARMPRED_007928 [Alectoria sarmentosa]
MAADSTSILQQLDSQLEDILAGWNIYTTLIALVLAAYLVSPLFFYTEPDVHPLLLARQSSASYVRQPKESATFRALETQHGYPLKSGLNVKDAGQPKWTSGRDGDLRDVWKRAVSGPVDADGKPTGGEAGRIITVYGKEEVIDHSFAKLSREINAVGQQMKVHGGTRVAIHMPNSVELLVTFFASAFYGLTPILIPQQKSLDTLAGILVETKADILVAGAGSLPLKELLPKYPNLKQVIWVVERTSRHMDWNEVAEGEGGKADIAVWHDIIDKGQASSELPDDVPGGTVTNVVMVTEDAWSAMDSYELTEFTQANFVAAIGAQISALPRLHRLAPTDTFTPLASLAEMYPLIVTLAALFSNASLALTSVSGPKAPYSAAFQGASPTVIVANTETLSGFCKDKERTMSSSPLGQFNQWRKAKTLKAGTMPKASGLTNTPRLIYTYDKAGASTVKLDPEELFKLKIYSGARLVYAFTDSQVAGAISQTNMLDYQITSADFGAPLSSVEIKLRDAEDGKTTDDKAMGELVVSGPAVVGGEKVVNQIMTVTDRYTLAYAS